MKKGFTDVANAPKRFYRRCKILLLLAALVPAGAGAAEEFELYLRAERFHWEEFVAGDRLLEEEGPRASIGLRGVLQDYGTWRLAALAETTLGRVDYDGETFGGDPVTDNTDYFGIRGEIDARFGAASGAAFRVQPLLGAGARYWLRRIAEGDTDEGGYDEGWFMFYGRAGAQVEWQAQPNVLVFARMVARPAIYNRTYYSIELEDDEDFSLTPGRDFTWEAEAGFRAGRYSFSAFYETLSFKESDSKTFGEFEVFQPESEGSIAGVQFGLVW
jgi:hypothetical protein